MSELPDIAKTFNMTEEETIKVIHYLYITEKYSITKLAKKLEVTDVSLRNWFKKYNLRTFKQGGHYKGKQVVITKKEYMSMTFKELCNKYSISPSQVYRLTRKYPRKLKRNFTPRQRSHPHLQEGSF